MDRDVHAYLIVEIVSVFKGWMDIVIFRFRCGAHLVNLALGSSEIVLRS